MVSYFWSTFSCLTIGPHVWIPFSFTLSNFTLFWSCFSFHFHLVLLLGGYCKKFSVRPVWLIPSIFFYLQSGQHSPLALLPICLSLFHHVMQSYSLRTHSTLGRGTLARYYPHVSQASRFGTQKLIPSPAKHLRWRIFEKEAKDFQRFAIFANCSVLDVCCGPECTSGYSGHSVEGFCLFLLVVLLAHQHTGSNIIFDFLTLSFPHHFWHRTHRVALSDQARKTVNHIPVYLFFAEGLCLSNVWF